MLSKNFLELKLLTLHVADLIVQQFQQLVSCILGEKEDMED